MTNIVLNSYIEEDINIDVDLDTKEGLELIVYIYRLYIIRSNYF